MRPALWAVLATSLASSCLLLAEPPTSLSEDHDVTEYWDTSQPSCELVCGDEPTLECLWGSSAFLVNCDGREDNGAAPGVCHRWTEDQLDCVFACVADCACVETCGVP